MDKKTSQCESFFCAIVLGWKNIYFDNTLHKKLLVRNERSRRGVAHNCQPTVSRVLHFLFVRGMVLDDLLKKTNNYVRSGIKVPLKC